MRFTIDFTIPVARSYGWSDIHRRLVRSYVFHIGDVELHVPNAGGHSVEAILPDGRAVEVGVVRKCTPLDAQERPFVGGECNA